MTADSRTDDAPMHPNHSRRSAVHFSATFLRLVILVGLLFAVSSLWIAITGRNILPGESGDSPYLTLTSLPQLNEVTPRGDDTIRIVDIPLWARVLAYAPGVITGVIMILASLKTVRVLAYIAAAKPFSEYTAQTIRIVGLLLAVGGVSAGLIDTTASLVFSRSSVSNKWQSVYSGLGFTGGDWPWTLIIVGCVVIAASAAFSEGARLQRENDSVV